MELSGLKINLQGFDPKSTNTFKDFFDIQCQKKFVISETLFDSDIIIVDIDSFKRSQIIDQLLIKKPNTPIIVISLFVYSHTDPIVFSFKKPFIQKDFFNLLQQVTLVSTANASPVIELRKALLNHIQYNLSKAKKNAKKHSDINCSSIDISPLDKSKISTLIGRQPDIDIENPHAVMRVLFDKKYLLLGSIQRGISRAKHSNKMLELTNFGHNFIIDPQTNSLFTFVSESVLRPLCLMSIEEVSDIKVIKNGRNSEIFQAMTTDANVEITEWSFDEILWKMALWSGRGKLPRDTDLSLPVTLSHWPNLTRLQVFPHALEIAAIMSQKPIRLTDIAAQLGIEQRYVFSFYTAANTIGIANNSHSQSDSLFQREMTPEMMNIISNKSQPLSMVNRMINFLTNAKPQVEKPTTKQQGVQ